MLESRKITIDELRLYSKINIQRELLNICIWKLSDICDDISNVYSEDEADELRKIKEQLYDYTNNLEISTS
jgi:hypothetical protein